MDRRQTLTAALITIGIVVLLILLTSIFKVRGDATHSPQITHQEIGAHEGNLSTEGSPIVINSKPEPYRVLIGCNLIEHRSNRGSLVHMEHNGKSFRLRLYYADAPWLQISDAEGTNSEGAIPHLAGEDLVELADASARFTLANLRDNTFKVFTRWEDAGDDDTFYGWILLRPGGNDPRYLSELLVANGYASILRSHAEPPAGNLTHSTFLQRLNSLQQVARSSGLGAFSRDPGA